VTAAQRLADLLDDLARQGTSVMRLVRGGRPAEPWRLYPGEEGIFDRQTRCQFYYHAHADRPEEDGHFHTVRLFPDRTLHLVGISMAADGRPRGLFTVNLWASGDAYASAAQLKRYVEQFRLRDDVEPRPLVQFINLVFRVFGAQIRQLQDAKIAALAQHRASHPGGDVFSDRSLEILSWSDIDVGQTIDPPAVTRA